MNLYKDKKYQVFLSSTFKDLKSVRQNVITSIFELGNCIPIAMEHFPSTDMGVKSIIENYLDGCDYYVLIIGESYGSEQQKGKGNDISYTHQEFRDAIKKKIPILSFIPDSPRFNISTGKKKLTKFEAFIKEVSDSKKTTPRRYSKKKEIPAKVIKSLSTIIRNRPRPGWIRTDETSQYAFKDLKNNLLKSKKASPFTCFYYTGKHHEIRQFNLIIDFSLKRGNKYPALQFGFHDTPSKEQPKYYIGSAIIKKNRLYLNLWDHEESIDELSMTFNIGELGSNQLKDVALLFGCYFGVCVKGKPTAGELILLRQKITVLDNKYKRYLNIRKSNFRSPDGCQVLKEEHTNKPHPIDIITDHKKVEFMVGQYRVWSYGKDGSINQSILRVNEDFSSTIETYSPSTFGPLSAKIKRETFNCEINVFGDRLCFGVFRKEESKETEFINHAILDISLLSRENDFIQGVYCGIGLKRPISGGIALLREDEKKIKATRYNKEEIASLIMENRLLFELKVRLNDIVEKQYWLTE